MAEPPAPDMSGAKFTSDTMPKTSAAVKCVVLLCVQYFVIYTLLAVVATINEFSGGRHQAARAVVAAMTSTVTLAPILAALFIGTRMRAIQLTQGDTEKYNLPQPWVQHGMFACVFALLGEVILVLLIPICKGQLHVPVTGRGDIDIGKARLKPIFTTIFTVVRFLLMITVYLGFLAIVAGGFLTKGPEAIWGSGQPPVSPALQCTMILGGVFFVVYGGAAIMSTIAEREGNHTKSIVLKLEGIFVQTKESVNMAPMICILFLAARMRALQIDPKHGKPQPWAEGAFYLCTFSVLFKVLVEVILPLADRKCKPREYPSPGEIAWEYSIPVLRTLGVIFQYVALLGLYAGLLAVMVSVLVITHPEDPLLTPPLSPAMQCVINLVVQYCVAYFLLFVATTLLQFLEKSVLVGTLFATFYGGTKTVLFAPMMAILFIAARVRALQLTTGKDGAIPVTAGPPTWAQECMFLATWSVMLQFVMAIALPWVLGPGQDEQMNNADFTYARPAGINRKVGIALDVVRYLSMLAMYGGVTGVVVATFIMTPETLPPYSEQHLVPGVAVPTPPPAELPAA